MIRWSNPGQTRLWQIGNCEQLDKIQRKCLALCLGTPATAGIEALEVEAKVEDEFQECRQIINEIFEEYILSTKRFKTQ